MIFDTGASLRIIGDFDPAQLSSDLELSPSFITNKGVKSFGREVVPFNIWGLSSPFEKTVPLEHHLEWLVNKFADKLAVLREIQKKNKIDIFCSVTLIGVEGLSLSPKSLSLISDLQINLEVSLITLADLDKEDLEDRNSD